MASDADQGQAFDAFLDDFFEDVEWHSAIVSASASDQGEQRVLVGRVDREALRADFLSGDKADI